MNVRNAQPKNTNFVLNKSIDINNTKLTGVIHKKAFFEKEIPYLYIPDFYIEFLNIINI